MLVRYLWGTAFPGEFQGSLLGCELLLFLKAVGRKVTPNLQINRYSLGVCGGKVPSWRADWLRTRAGLPGIVLDRNFVCVQGEILQHENMSLG